MLLNLSNHPSNLWSEEQRTVATNRFGDVEDLPFPKIPPTITTEEVAEIVSRYVQRCVDVVASQNALPLVVHVMGEFTFTYLFVSEMERKGILCVASTTERIGHISQEGEEIPQFKFVKFRPYF